MSEIVASVARIVGVVQERRELAVRAAECVYTPDKYNPFELTSFRTWVLLRHQEGELSTMDALRMVLLGTLEPLSPSDTAELCRGVVQEYLVTPSNGTMARDAGRVLLKALPSGMDADQAVAAIKLMLASTAFASK